MTLLLPPSSRDATDKDDDIELAEALQGVLAIDGVQQQQQQQQRVDEFSVPGDVCTVHQLDDVPVEFVDRRDAHRPLLHVDEGGNKYAYALSPMKYSVHLILLLELLERFSFYGLYMTQTNYLTGSYDVDGGWNANMTSMDAASLISLSTAVAYTVPFVGGTLADAYLGDYWTILVGFAFFYLPGVFVIASSTRPNRWLGTDSFNVGAYKIALLFLWPVGTGTVKAVVNIFGARQYHPILQRSLIETFYVKFYMIINIGACLGFMIMPIIARENITVAYAMPLLLLLVALTFFAVGYTRYVHVAPVGRNRRGRERMGECEDDAYLAADDDEKPNFGDVARVCLLIIPFSIVYQQCPTTFMVQGAVMEPFLGFIEAPSINILDTVSVLVCGYLVSSLFYPYLARNNIRFPTGYKFALGCAFGACAILWSILVESMIHEEYARTGGRINVIWSAPSYIMIGAGEMFSISTGYEVAFTASPPNKKAFACAFNLFCIGGVPNLVSLVLYRLCRRWFETDSGGGNIGRIENYSEAHVVNYFWVLFGIIVSGMIVNMNKSVREWIKSVEQRAANALSRSVPSTPKTPKGGPSKRKVDDAVGETDPLLKAKKQMKYLERGTRASIYRANTMKAEFLKQNSPSPRKKLIRNAL